MSDRLYSDPDFYVRVQKTKLAIVVVGLAAAALLHLGDAKAAQGWTSQPTPVAKNGACPTGYYSSGDYCMPSESAGAAVPKSGACPTGYYSSGNYCVASRDSGYQALPAGSKACPVGFYLSNNYCVKRMP